MELARFLSLVELVDMVRSLRRGPALSVARDHPLTGPAPSVPHYTPPPAYYGEPYIAYGLPAAVVGTIIAGSITIAGATAAPTKVVKQLRCRFLLSPRR